MSTNRAGNTRNDSVRFSIVTPASTSTRPAITRIGADSMTIRRRTGSPLRSPATSATMQAIAQKTATIGVKRWNAEQVGRDEQARQRGDVARRGDDRRGDVVEVPAALRALRRDADGDREHDERREQRADNRHDHEVGDRHRRLAEGDGNRLGEHGQRERRRQREHQGRGDVLTDRGVEPARHPERAGVDQRAESASEATEDVSPHPDRGRDEHEQPGKAVQGVGDGTEREPGDEIAAG